MAFDVRWIGTNSGGLKCNEDEKTNENDERMKGLSSLIVSPVGRDFFVDRDHLDLKKVQEDLEDYIQGKLNEIASFEELCLEIPENSEEEIQAFPVFLARASDLSLELPENDSLISNVEPWPENLEQQRKIIEDLYRLCSPKVAQAPTPPSTHSSSGAEQVSPETQQRMQGELRTPNAVHLAYALQNLGNGKNAQRKLQNIQNKPRNTLMLMDQNTLRKIMEKVREGNIERCKDQRLQVRYGNNEKFIFDYHENGNPTIVPYRGDNVIPLTGEQAAQYLRDFRENNPDRLSFIEFVKRSIG